VIIAGGHGKIALQLGTMLAARGEQVRGLIRNPDHAADLEAAGVAPVVWDLERDDPGLAEVISGAGAVVFAAGAGPGSGAPRKQTMDRDGAIRLIDACLQAGVRRYLMISAMGARDAPPSGGGVFGDYLRAKAQADQALAASGLDYTIIRPGALTDEPPTGRVALAPELAPGSITRADVAGVLLAVLDAPNTVRKTFDVTAGTTPIETAIAGV
jgi:uncharacterized protein YbjT (DUF2867 family)